MMFPDLFNHFTNIHFLVLVKKVHILQCGQFFNLEEEYRSFGNLSVSREPCLRPGLPPPQRLRREQQPGSCLLPGLTQSAVPQTTPTAVCSWMAGNTLRTDSPSFLFSINSCWNTSAQDEVWELSVWL